jgi:DNA-binding response OmpR family regulator
MDQKRILVVEDSPDWQKIARKVIEAQGHEMTLAANFHDGERAIASGPFDLYVFDNTLGAVRNASPDLIEAVHLLVGRDVKIIVYSADLPVMTRKRVEELGAQYVCKTTAYDLDEPIRTAFA